MEVAICGRQDKELRRALETIKKTTPSAKATTCVADVSKAADVSNLFTYIDRELGGLDILINNAGLRHIPPHCRFNH